MARAHYAENIVGVSGGGSLSLLSGATVHVYDQGTTDHIAQTIYDSDAGVGTLSNPLTSDANGLVEFWLDNPVRVDLAISKAGFTSQTRTVDVEAAASGGGSGVLYQAQVFDVSLPVGESVALTLDPTDTDHVAVLVDDGYPLNTPKNGIVPPALGDYLVSVWGGFTQHATEWGLFEVSDVTALVYFQVPVPPISVVNLSGQYVAASSSGIMRVATLDPNGVSIFVRSRLQTATLGSVTIGFKRLGAVPA